MTAEERIVKARRALASARLLLMDGDTDGAVNRAYYGMFDAARAALLAAAPESAPDTIKTHRGLITAFGQWLVKPQEVPANLGRILNQVERVRLLADYTGDPIDAARAGWAIDQAQQFLDTITAITGNRPDGDMEHP